MAGQALAQPVAQPAVDTELEEIIVTAQKRTERLEDVPISITAMSGETMERAGVKNIQDLGQISVGVHIGHLATFVQPTIRGVTATQVTGTLSGNVGVYVDGFYMASPYSLNQDLVSVSNVQIVKGPQGTLFGRNTTGGAMLIDTRDPTLNDASGQLRLSYGTFNEKVVQGYVTAPFIEDVLGFDLTVYKRVSDGYLKDIGGAFHGPAAPVDMEAVRSKILWQASEDLSLTLILNYSDVNDATNSARTVWNQNLTAEQVPGTIFATRPYELSLNFPTGTRDTARSASLKVEYDFGWATLRSLTHLQNEHSELLQDTDGTPVPKTRVLSYNTYNYGTQEFNLSGSTERADWVVGAFYMKFVNRPRAEVNRPLDLAAPMTPPAVGISPGPTRDILHQNEIEAYAMFFDGTLRVTDRLSLIGGARFSWDKNMTHVRRPVSSADPSSPNYLPNPELHSEFEAFTPRAVLQYELAPNTNVYASYAKGYKSGGYGGGQSVPKNELNQPGNYPVRPEESTAYELGFKTAQQTWRLNAAAFYNQYKDQQVSAVILQPLAGGGFNSVLLPMNAARSNIMGVEVEAVWSPIQNLNLRGGVGYLDAKYDSFPNSLSYQICPAAAPAVCRDTTVTPAQDVPAGYNSINQVSADISGLQMIRSPKWSLVGGFDYTIPTGTGDIVLSSNASYRSSYVESDTSLIPGTREYRYRQDGYVLVNSQVSWSPGNSGLTVRLWGNNLTDEVVYSYNVGTAQGDARSWAPPRTYGVTLDYEF